MYWKNKSLRPGTHHTKHHYHLSDILDENGLTQLVEIRTRNDSILDLFITNIPTKVLNVNTTPGISDHNIVYMELDINVDQRKQKLRTIPLYKRANWNSMKEETNKLSSKIEEDEKNGATVKQL